MTDTGSGRAVPNFMETVTFSCHSRLMRASSGVLSGVKSKTSRVLLSLKAFRLTLRYIWAKASITLPVVKLVFTSNF